MSSPQNSMNSIILKCSKFTTILYKTILILVIFFIFNRTNVFALAEQNRIPGTIKVVKIAIRAHSGVEEAIKKWSATIDYLNHSVDGYTFQMVPLITFEEMRSVVKNNEVEFVLTNPTAYIDLSVKYKVARIATLINGRDKNGHTEFGGVIFTNADRDDIKSLRDVKGKSIMGVHKEAFGGWQMAYRELLEIGIDPFNDCSKVLFSPGGTQQEIAYNVLQGKVDVGTVRTGILENLEKKGEIDLHNIKIIEPKADNFPLPHTTRLYPEWPFSVTENTDEQLARKVAIALLQMEKKNPAAEKGSYSGWKVPLSYNQVLLLLKILKVSPFEDYGKFSALNFLKLYWYWFLIIPLTVAGLIFLIIYIYGLNTKLNEIRLKLEERVKEKTTELNQMVVNLQAEIKKRKRTEDTLRVKKSELTGILQAMDDFVFVLDKDNYFVSYFAPEEKLYLRPDMFLGKTHKEIMPPAVDQKFNEALEIVKQGKTAEYDYYLEKEADVSWYLIKLSAIMEEGEYKGLVAVSRDITVRKQMERKLNKTNRLYATLSQVNQAIVRERDKQKLFQEICNIAIEFGKFRLAWIGLVDEANKLVNPVAFSGEDSDYLQNIKIILTNDVAGKGPTGRSIREGKSVVFNDLENNPDFVPWRKQALEKGYRSSAAFPLRLNNKAIGAFNVYAVEPFFFDEDEINLLEEAAMDISFALEKFEEEDSRRQTEKKLHESEEKFRILYNNSPDMYVSVSPDDASILLCNETLLSKTGYSREEIIGFPVFKIYHDDCLDEVEKVFQQFVATGIVQDKELIIKRKDGGRIDVSLNVEAVRDEAGKILYSISSWRDITERKQAKAALNESETRFGTLLSNLPGMAYQCKNDEQWTMLFINDACEQLTGYKPEQLVYNRDISYYELIHPDDQVFVSRQVEEALNTGEHFELEYRIISADGREKWVWERGVQTTLQDHGPKLLEGVIHDITKRKQAEEALKRSKGKLIKSNKELQLHMDKIIAIHRAGQRLQMLKKPETLAQEIITVMEEILNYKYGAVLLFDESGGKLLPFAISDQGKGETFLQLDKAYIASHNIKPGTGIVGWVAQHGKSVRLGNIKQDPRYYPMRNDIHSELCVPLKVNEKIIGVVNIETSKLNAFTEIDQLVLETIASQIAIAIQNSTMFKQVKEYAFELEQNITERRQAEEALHKSSVQLRALSAHLQSVREEERTAIAREIHDELGQILTVLKMDLSLMGRDLNEETGTLNKAALLDEIKSMTGLIDKSIQQLRKLITELRPEVLDNLGLIAALEWQSQEFQARSKIKCKLETSIKDIEISKERAIAIFRIFQEALTNILRHAQATHVTVNISEKDNNILLKIADNGIGISADKKENSNTFGLLGMQERAIVFGGEVIIESGRGKGTSIMVRIPIISE